MAGRSPGASAAAVPRVPAGGALGVAVSVALLHGLNDAYAAFLHPLLPRIMERLELSIALAATLAMVLSLASSLIQPLMGLLADRRGHRLFVVGGPVLSGVFLSLIGVAPSFSVLVVFLLLGGLGSAAFHPPGASLAVRVSEGAGSGARYSIFSVGGALGYAVGPLAAVGLVAWLGMEGLWVAMLPVLVCGAVLWSRLPPSVPRGSRPSPVSGRAVLRMLAGPLGLLFGISALGAFLQRVFLTMQPIIVHQGGGSEALGAFSLTVYLVGQAVGTLAAGLLTDHMDRRTLLLWLILLSVPAHLAAFTLAPGAAAGILVTALAGALNMALLPPVVVMAQEMVPEGAGLLSGIVMGLAWAAGSVGVLGTGVLGDWVGAREAALASVPLMLVGVGLAMGVGRGGPRVRGAS